MNNVTPMRPDGQSPKRSLNGINADLVLCRATLQCAAVALVKAEDGSFEDDANELAAAAISVVQRCCRELLAIEEAIDRLSIEAAQPSCATYRRR
jgi:hypothetical protein